VSRAVVRYRTPVAAPRTPTPAEAPSTTPNTPARVTPPAGPVEKLSPLIAVLHTGESTRCTQNAVRWSPKELPRWTSNVADVARLSGGCSIPMSRGSPLAMLVILSELKVMLYERAVIKRALGLSFQYMKLENCSAAIEALRNVVRIKPDYTSAYQMLGSALVKQEGREEGRRV